MPEVAGRAKRVTGVFVFMIGAGCILDWQAGWVGALGMLAGVATFVWGMMAVPPAVHAPITETPPAGQPTESHP